jgi:hypothetical protein
MRAALFGVFFLMLSSVASAQSTPYKTDNFTATFNGPVKSTTERNLQGTSTDVHFSSKAGDVEQMISIRLVDHDIDVDTAPIFYANQTLKNGTRTLLSHKEGIYKKKHPWSLITFADTRDNVITRWHTWFIIIDSRTVMIVAQEAPMGDHEDNPEWEIFISSLNIKM